MEEKRDIHQSITDQIVAAIEAGAGSYQMPWNPRFCSGTTSSIPFNPVGYYGYRGVNILNLWGRQQAQSYPTAEWATFCQWQSVGAQVRKGERGALTVFYKEAVVADERSSAEQEGETRCRRRLIARAAYVFNLAQVEGFVPRQLPQLSKIEQHGDTDKLIAASRATILHGGVSACYVSASDEIHLPRPEAFHNSTAYYSVALHELTHWTGHESRCARDLRSRFGTETYAMETYAMEELIAELGAAFLSAEIGLAIEPRIDHARYIESWLKVLKNDKRAIFTAAAKASQATAFLTQLAAEGRI